MSVAKLSSLLLAVGMALPAAPVLAQSFPPTNVEVQIGDEVRQPADILFINSDDCRENTPIKITLTRLGSTHAGLRFLEYWVAASTGEDCHAVKGRTWTSGTEQTPCDFIGFKQDPDLRDQEIVFRARDLFVDSSEDTGSTDGGTSSDEVCNRVGDVSLYLVPLANRTSNPGGVTEAISPKIEIQFNVDVAPLSAPGSVRGGSGETQVTLSWDPPSGADQFTDYELYFDTTAIVSSSGSSCSSDLLVAGKPVDRNADGLERVNPEGTSYNADPAALGLAVGEMLPAAVVSRDRAGNRSAASTVVCVRRVETTSFWDECRGEQECREGFHTCSLSFGSREGWFGIALGLVGLALWVRRRRTV